RHFLFKIEQEVPYFYLRKVRFYENVSFSVPSNLSRAFLCSGCSLDFFIRSAPYLHLSEKPLLTKLLKGGPAISANY
ncbi:hypothetical protein ACQKOF_22525, partial [Lysinibacillus sp. NPDC093190]|uniref:hypothetical protein n=1 Tax=Lysinibacillus sp. NPDC093190 TaxID=3390575 RepID=UPI003D085114